MRERSRIMLIYDVVKGLSDWCAGHTFSTVTATILTNIHDTMYMQHALWWWHYVEFADLTVVAFWDDL